MTKTLTDKSVKAFLDELSSAAPAPGGGSVAAFAGSFAPGTSPSDALMGGLPIRSDVALPPPWVI